MRILLLHNRYREPGGEDAVVHNEVELLAGRGHEVDVLEVANPQDTRSTLPIIARAIGNAHSADLVEQRIASFRPDVVHLHNWWFTLTPAVVPAVAATGTPIVATVHNHRLGCADATFFRNGQICTRCLGGSVWRSVALACHRESRLASAAIATTLQAHRRRGTWDQVDRWLPLSNFQADLLARSGVDRERMVVKPNAVPDPGARATPPSDSRTVVVLGRLVAEKGVGVLLEAWGRAELDLELVVVGDGELREELERLRTPNTRFAGRLPRDEVQRLLSTSRALVFPVQWLEPFGMVLVEAMAAGLPVLASDLGAVHDVLGDHAGWRTGADVDSWAGALPALLDDVEVDRRGAAGRERHAERFTPDRIGEALEQIYRSVLDEPRSERASRRT